jgi:hypothetical protein
MSSSSRPFAAVVLAFAGLFVASSVWAQTVTPFLSTSIVNTRAVGGVSIDPDGVLNNTMIADQEMLRKMRQETLRKLPNELNQTVGLRKISLSKLEAAARDILKKGGVLPEEIRYLAGLQRIQYVFIYPETHDIVLAGPGEGWTVNDRGTVVGVTTGRPVLLFDDLLVALRTASTSNNGGISCSIDPTPEGIARVNEMNKRHPSNDPQQVAAQWEELLGPQSITVTGVPASSHFARVMVAADYRMKRLAMKFDESPVRGMPSFLDMVSGGSAGGGTGVMPRWWLASSYEPLNRDAEGLSWELRGAGVKAMAEEDFMSSLGQHEKSQKASPMVQKWADNMTAKYDELSGKDTVFAELRNCMDLAVVAALIVREQMPEKASCSIATLMDAKQLPTEEYFPPKQVATKASFIRKGRSTTVTASGGVQILPWQTAEKQSESDKLSPIRAANSPQSDKWWWN